MGNTTIQWTDYTVNFWHGCKKVSAGCKFCYMYRDKEKYGQDPEVIVKRDFNIIRRELKKLPAGYKIFTCSWSDFFIKEADGWREEAWQIIKENPQLQWQILTKRPERIKKHLPKDWGDGYNNVWLGVSVENDSISVTQRIVYLRLVPAKIKFISFEPLIGSMFYSFVADVSWIIIGGESGNDKGLYKYRPCKLEWIEFVVDSYRNQHPGTAVFVKQLGTHLSKELKMSDRHGSNINEFPAHLQIRGFPIYNK